MKQLRAAGSIFSSLHEKEEVPVGADIPEVHCGKRQTFFTASDLSDRRAKSGEAKKEPLITRQNRTEQQEHAVKADVSTGRSGRNGGKRANEGEKRE